MNRLTNTQCILALALMLTTLLGMTSCEDNLTTSDRPGYPPEKFTKEYLMREWAIDIDGNDDINAATAIIRLGENGGTHNSYVIDLRTNKLVVEHRPIKSWDIIHNYDGYEKDGIKGDALRIETDENTMYLVPSYFDNDSIILDMVYDLGELGRIKSSMKLVRKDSPDNHAFEITANDEEAGKIAKSYMDAIEPEYQMGDMTGGGYDGSSWMSLVDDPTLLRNISIPGTHDSGTYGVVNYLSFMGTTQPLTIEQQWNCGVRSFDLRVRNYVVLDVEHAEKRTIAELCHGPLGCDIDFKDAFKTIVDKVKGSDECAFVFINTEGNDATDMEFLEKALGAIKGVVDALGLRSEKLDEALTRNIVAEDINHVLGADKDNVLGYYSPGMTMKDARGRVFIINRIPDEYKYSDFNFVGQGVVGKFKGLKDIISDKHETLNGAIYVSDLYFPDEKTGVEHFDIEKIKEFYSLCDDGTTQITEDKTKVLYFNSASSSHPDFFWGKWTPIPNYCETAQKFHGPFANRLDGQHTCGIMPQDFAGVHVYERASLNSVAEGAIKGAGISLSVPGALYGMLHAEKIRYFVNGYQFTNAVINNSIKPTPLSIFRINKDIIQCQPQYTDSLWTEIYPTKAVGSSIKSWESSNSSVATIDNSGHLKVLSLGNATITVTLKSGLKALCYIISSDSKIKPIDLGLSVKWGDRNLGAATPTDVGILYAWGEKDVRSGFTADRYLFGADPSHYSTYCLNDGKLVLEPNDDVVRAMYGEGWRMPTKAEVDELIAESAITTSSYKGTQAVKVSRNGMNIYLPKTYYINGYEDVWGDSPCGYYWTSSIARSSATQTTDWGQAYCMSTKFNNSSIIGTTTMARYLALPIRPVYDPNGVK